VCAVWLINPKLRPPHARHLSGNCTKGALRPRSPSKLL
jgi:hypothetical protein